MLERVEGIEPSYEDWKSPALTTVLYPQMAQLLKVCADLFVQSHVNQEIRLVGLLLRLVRIVSRLRYIGNHLV